MEKGKKGVGFGRRFFWGLIVGGCLFLEQVEEGRQLINFWEEEAILGGDRTLWKKAKREFSRELARGAAANWRVFLFGFARNSFGPKESKEQRSEQAIEQSAIDFSQGGLS
ncbi:unnamed protein product [Linum trigynum]|uniref:Uncharacterized protein n=1 Tax=Linum trigynum TaxID=586398 RepID=A0AAV2D686_9ROSI